MVDFDTLESGVEGSRPLEIYLITSGPSTYRYTNAEDDITVGGDVYAAHPIARTATQQGSEPSRATLTLTVPGTNPFAARHHASPPGQTATVTIWGLQRDETPSFATRALLYKGTVQSLEFSADGAVAEIACRSAQGLLSKTVPRRTCMGSCNNFLYDSRCKVDPALFSFTGVVTAVNGNVITVTGANSKPDGYWTGYAKPAAESDPRIVLRHVGNDLTLLMPFENPVLGVDVQVFAGCDHKLNGDCANKFDNVIEFGGFAFVPLRNPFESGLES